MHLGEFFAMLLLPAAWSAWVQPLDDVPETRFESKDSPTLSLLYGVDSEALKDRQESFCRLDAHSSLGRPFLRSKPAASMPTPAVRLRATP